ncbi:MAG: cytochrome b [Pseudomonadota bacterium]
MSIRNTEAGWGWLARLIHWSSGLVILYMLGLGVYMTQFVSDIYEQFAWTQVHKSWGFVAFVLALARIGWRFVNPTPELPGEMTALERLGARLGHLALYGLVIAMPVTGWLMSTASTLQDSYGIKNMVFGLFEMPDPFVPGSSVLEEIFSRAHTASAIALGLLVAGHIAVALRHQFVKRDGLLRRMIVGPEETA